MFVYICPDLVNILKVTAGKELKSSISFSGWCGIIIQKTNNTLKSLIMYLKVLSLIEKSFSPFTSNHLPREVACNGCFL